MLKDNHILLLALDSMLLELDPDYVGVEEEVADLLFIKTLEAYGLDVDSTSEDIDTFRTQLFNDVTDYRNKLINDFKEGLNEL